MRLQLSDLEGQSFDVAVIGAGVNGASAAQHLAAAGYRTLLVDRGDFASGSSSRSSRLLHCGLRYLAPGRSMMDFLLHPGRFKTACTMARAAMACRQQFALESPERVKPFDFYFPITRRLPYKPWQIALAFRLLAALGPKEVPLDYSLLDPATVRRTPLIGGLRDLDSLLGVAKFREYRFEWPERIVMDTILDAERLGAVARNYTAVTGLVHRDGAWRLRLEDQIETGLRAEVTAQTIVNMAGIWIDRVNGLAAQPVGRKITGTKGMHIVVRLPPDCANVGIATLHRGQEPFYCVPWRGLHFFGPTETLYEGDPDGIVPTEAEIEWLLGEANHLLPGLGLTRGAVISAWAGVRPLTYDPAQPRGARARQLRDLTAEGMPDALAMTAGPIMTHRSAGAEVLSALAARREPSGPPGRLSYAARPYGQDPSSPALLNEWPEIRLSDLKTMAETEQVTGLTDLLARRAGVAWTESAGAGVAEQAARAVAETLGWDEARVAQEVAAYRAYLARHHAGPFAARDA